MEYVLLNLLTLQNYEHPDERPLSSLVSILSEMSNENQEWQQD